MDRENTKGRNRNTVPSVTGRAGGYPSGNHGRHERSRNNIEARNRNQNWLMQHKVFSIIMLMVLLVAIIIGGIIIYTANNSGALLINRDNNGNQSAVTDEQGRNYNFPNNVVNILILGTDGDAARIKQGMNARTDCVMLASINTTTKKVSLISIPRDTYVNIYDENNKVVAKNRINAAFAFGGGLKKNGIPYSINTISHFLGGNVPIDHYVLFDMDLVKSLINAVGGVTIDVDISVDVNSIHLRPGVKKLSGIEALTYARDRHNTPGGDFGRVGHQQQVMIALLKELQNKGNIVRKIPELYSALSKNVTTDPDMGLLQITALAWIAKDVEVNSLKQYTLHGDCLTINGASIVVADQKEKQSILKEAFGIDYKIKNDETYSYLKGEITRMLNTGKGIISTAKSLLNNNKEFYSADEAKDLLNAIADWQAASKKNDSEGMANAQQDVQTEYEILKHLIDGRKATPTDNPAPTDSTTPKESVAPADSPSPADSVVPTDSQEPTDSLVPTDNPTPTDSAVPPAADTPAATSTG